MKNTISFFIFICAMPFLLLAEQSSSNEFMKGYVYSKLENRFPYANIEFDVVGSDIFVYGTPADLKFQEIENYLHDQFPSYRVLVNTSPPICYEVESAGRQGPSENIGHDFQEETFLPELHPFFPTMLAQPHILGYSVGYRSYDKIFKSTIPVSIGDQFSLLSIPDKILR